MLDRMMAHPKLTMYAGLAALAAVGYAYWYITDDDRKSGFVQDMASAAGGVALDLVDTVTQPINPTNPNNIFNRAVESVGASITGDSTWTPANAIYDRVNNGITPLDRLNPMNPNNVVNSYVDWVGQVVTGEKHWTLGGQIADWMD